MQRIRNLFNDDSAVSPVIGVILMVAITVILAAVIASFVLGLGDSADDVQPNISVSDSQWNVSGEFEDGNNDKINGTITFVELEVTSADGDADASELYIRGDAGEEIVWEEIFEDNDAEAAAGEEVAILVGSDDLIADGGNVDIEDVQSGEFEGYDFGDGEIFAFEDTEVGDEIDLVFETEDTSSVLNTWEVEDL